MPTLETLRTGTFPLTMIEDEHDALIFNIFRNKNTKAARDEFRAGVKSATAKLDKARRDSEKLQEEMNALDLNEAIAAKLDALNALEADAEGAAALRQEVEQLQQQGRDNAPKIEALGEKMGILGEEAEAATVEIMARQLAFMVESTNVRETEAEDAPFVAASQEFFQREFDLPSLFDFAGRISQRLDSPLASRHSTSSK